MKINIVLFEFLVNAAGVQSAMMINQQNASTKQKDAYQFIFPHNLNLKIIDCDMSNVRISPCMSIIISKGPP